MSVLGPRPLPADQVAANRELLARRGEARPGLTGWQIHGRFNLSYEDAIRPDLSIVNRSLAFELSSLLRTVSALVFRRGAVG